MTVSINDNRRVYRNIATASAVVLNCSAASYTCIQAAKCEKIGMNQCSAESGVLAVATAVFAVGTFATHKLLMPTEEKSKKEEGEINKTTISVAGTPILEHTTTANGNENLHLLPEMPSGIRKLSGRFLRGGSVVAVLGSVGYAIKGGAAVLSGANFVTTTVGAVAALPLLPAAASITATVVGAGALSVGVYKICGWIKG